MKKNFHLFFAVIAATIFFSGMGQAQKFSLLVSDGYGTVKVGDYNSLLTGAERILSLLAQEYSLTKAGSFKKINMRYEFDGEFLVQVKKHFSIGFGAGYTQRDTNQGVDLTGAGQYITYTLNSRFVFFPIKVSGHFFYSIFPTLNVYINGGVGYYFGRATYTHTYEQGLMSPAIGSSHDGEIKSGDIGFHSGVGLKFKVIPRVSLFIEGRALLCRLRPWKGNELYTELSGFSENRSGKAWYYELPVNGVGYLPEIATGEFPVPVSAKNVREFSFDLTGSSIRLGIIVHL